MSIKPKYSSADSNAAERCETTFFMWDAKGGGVAVETAMPAEGVAWPLQILRITGPGAAAPPKSPMTDAEFTAWRHALDAAGFDLDVRFK